MYPAPAYPGSAYPSAAGPSSLSRPAADASAVEMYGPVQALRQLGSALLFLPGSSGQQQVQFATLNGRAVLDGDIMLGAATTLPLRYGIPWQSSADRKGAVAVANRDYLWPRGEIPYVIDASAERKRPAIEAALRLFAGTPLSFRPRAVSDRDYVVFRELGEGCWSYLGRQGGAQEIDVSTCAAGNVAHELMHAAGFYHEHSRGDRDEHVTILWDEVSPEMRSNFEKRDARGQDIGAYDYASIMHYSAYAGSRTGRPTIVPRASNVQIGQREALSALDRAAIDTLYGGARREPPVAAAPPPPAPVPVSTPPVIPAPPVVTAPPPSAPAAPSATPPPPAPAPASNDSYAGTYGSVRGNVSCTQGGVFVQCQYPGGNLFCAASGPELACTWSGGGQGRATFQRQPSGVLAGAWGDGFSTNSRGRWDLTPLGGAPAASAPPPSGPAPIPSAPPAASPAPTTPSAPPAPAAAVSLSGNYDSSRGRMACVDSGTSVSCNFQEPDGVGGRLDCATSANGAELSCAWITFMPRPATGRASFTRPSPRERQLRGTWGYFLSPSGGGTWDLRGM